MQDRINDRAVTAFDVAAAQAQAAAQSSVPDYLQIELDVDKITFGVMEDLENSTKFSQLRQWLLAYTNLTNERIRALTLIDITLLCGHIQQQVQRYIRENGATE